MRTAKRTDSKEVQGDGSWVELNPISYKSMREVAQRAEEAPKDADGNPRLAFSVQDEHLQRVVKEAVKDWNWTDSANEPLPTPHMANFSLDLLTIDEIRFIYQAATNGKDTEVKAKN